MNGGGWDRIAEGLAFPEAPRWHEGSFWCSDIFAGEVLRIGDGEPQVVLQLEGRPSGLGWRGDGTMLVVSMDERRLLGLPPGDTVPVTIADLAPVATGPANDMIVDDRGRAYIGNFGYDYAAGAERRPARLAMVDVDGTVHAVADDLWFPNGMAITPDGATLLVAETPMSRVTAFAIDADGRLSHRSSFAELEGARPDGIALDAEGALWVASPGTGELVRVAAGGEVLESVDLPVPMVQACMLGGSDGRLLLACASPTHDARTALDERGATLICRRVAVPAATNG